MVVKISDAYSEDVLQEMMKHFRGGLTSTQVGQLYGLSGAQFYALMRSKFGNAPLKGDNPASRHRRMRLGKVENVRMRVREDVIDDPRSKLEGRAVDITELGRGECRWPVTKGSNHLFCGLARQSHRSYCDEHHTRSVKNIQTGVSGGQRRIFKA